MDRMGARVTDRGVFSKLENVGVVVSDLDAAAAHFQSFGLGPFGYVAEGMTRAPGLRTRRTMVGATGVELIQPIGASVWGDFLREKGEGLMHMGFEVGDVDRAEADLAKAGLQLLYRTRFDGGGGVSGFDTRKHGGLVMEVVQHPPGGPGGSPNGPLPFSFIHHIGLVVRDIDAAVGYYEGLGFGPFAPLKLSGERTERTQHGAPTPYRLKNAGTHIGSSPVELEFLQPLESAPLQEEFLRTKGEGANHLGFKVPDVEPYTLGISSKGFDVVLTVAFTSGTKCKYLDTSRRGGLMVEFWQPPNA